MARRQRGPKASGRQSYLDGYTSLPNGLLAHRAVRTLQPSHFMVLVYLAMKCRGQTFNGELAFSNRAGCQWWDAQGNRWADLPISGLSRSTVGAALRELECRGLIECTQQSTFNQKRLAKQYRLTWIKTKSGPATHDYRNSEARPTHRPIGDATGQPIGTTPLDDGGEGAIQADPSAYSEPHRPTHRPFNNQIIGTPAASAQRPARARQSRGVTTNTAAGATGEVPQ